MPRDWRDGGEDRETLVARGDLSHREEEEQEEGEGSLQQQSRPAHQDSVYKYGTTTKNDGSVGIRIRMFLGLPDPLVRGTDPDPSLFLIKVLSGLQ
jgi:hypothetical protein